MLALEGTNDCILISPYIWILFSFKFFDAPLKAAPQKHPPQKHPSNMVASSVPKWLPLESNPDVMNDYLAKLGIPASENLAFSDVWSLDPENLAFLPHPVRAFILLFPVTAIEKGAVVAGTVVPGMAGVFWVKQTIGNACGTMAILHSLANLEGVDLGSGLLRNTIERLTPLNADARAQALEQDVELASLHASSSMEGQTAAPGAEDEVDLHFVAFVPVGGKLVELDGGKEGPVVHGDIGEAGFVTSAVEVIQRAFIQRDPTGNSFTVVALGAKQE
ncbi:hypothetical protein BC830DRAFT_1142148 [Chytriomyces sp. MP71]|nr:hypothetical protein BC830DRAFT_1142148 [Chytriomyces sp. MP71]